MKRFIKHILIGLAAPALCIAVFSLYANIGAERHADGDNPHRQASPGDTMEIQASTALSGKWKVKAYADLFSSDMTQGIADSDGNYTLRLSDKGTFYLTTDCNTISGRYTTDSRRLKFLNAISTEMACDREFAEHRLKACISQTEKYDLPTDSTLRLLSCRNTVLILLEK